MHELPLTERIAEIVLGHARGARVTGVHLVIGELSGASGECIGFYWQAVSRGTCAEGAALHVRRVPFVLVCLGCDREFAPGADYRCPACGGERVRVARGDELYVEAIDVADLDAGAGTHGAPAMGAAT